VPAACPGILLLSKTSHVRQFSTLVLATSHVPLIPCYSLLFEPFLYRFTEEVHRLSADCKWHSRLPQRLNMQSYLDRLCKDAPVPTNPHMRLRTLAGAVPADGHPTALPCPPPRPLFTSLEKRAQSYLDAASRLDRATLLRFLRFQLPGSSNVACFTPFLDPSLFRTTRVSSEAVCVGLSRWLPHTRNSAQHQLQFHDTARRNSDPAFALDCSGLMGRQGAGGVGRAPAPTLSVSHKFHPYLPLVITCSSGPVRDMFVHYRRDSS
jgi:hypothetical protein